MFSVPRFNDCDWSKEGTIQIRCRVDELQVLSEGLGVCTQGYIRGILRYDKYKTWSLSFDTWLVCVFCLHMCKKHRLTMYQKAVTMFYILILPGPAFCVCSNPYRMDGKDDKMTKDVSSMVWLSKMTKIISLKNVMQFLHSEKNKSFTEYLQRCSRGCNLYRCSMGIMNCMCLKMPNSSRKAMVA